MNYADARQVATALNHQGFQPTSQLDDADVIILQTCTVRQQSEDSAIGRLQSLKPRKAANPDLTIAMMGCVVGVRGNEALARRYPFVDVWMPPASDGRALIAHLSQKDDLEHDRALTRHRFEIQDGLIATSVGGESVPVSAPVAIVYGCSHACSFCIIPQRRGIERSRPIGEIAVEVNQLVARGVKEVVLLGQIVDRYGYEVDDGPDLADLLRAISDIEGLERIRFLTSHPSYMTDRILQAVADLPKVMPQLEIPIQAGDDLILEQMKRGYSSETFRELVFRARKLIPNVAIHTDVIVGFPGEDEERFMRTYRILEELELDKVHLARYSPRPGTVSARRMADDVEDGEKRQRFQQIEDLQRRILQKKNSSLLDCIVEVLVEDRQKGRWRGRTPQGRLVFFDSELELRGQTVDVEVSYAGPWSVSGRLVTGAIPQTGDRVAIPLAAGDRLQ